MSKSWVHLISANDLDALSSAFRRMQRITLIRTLGNTEVTVCVSPAHQAWHVAMLVQVRVKEWGIEWVQTFESMEEVRKAIEQSERRMVGIY